MVGSTEDLHRESQSQRSEAVGDQPIWGQGKDLLQRMPGAGQGLVEPGSVRTHLERAGASSGSAAGERRDAEYLFTDKQHRRVKLCPVCGIDPLPPGRSACSTKCRKRKERILKKAREESLLYRDD